MVAVSLNAILGDRTEANGWKLAPGYVSGRSEDQPGGGVCQISSTLYCAALKADLSIVQRQNHSIPVGYIAQGLDALSKGLVDEALVDRALDMSARGVEVALTGRAPSRKIVEKADYITEMRCKKHPYEQGICAREGVEY